MPETDAPRDELGGRLHVGDIRGRGGRGPLLIEDRLSQWRSAC
jgi:hypothetical protein